MKKLIEYFIKYPVAGNVIIFLIITLGYFGFTSLKSTTMPQVDPGNIIVSTQYPGASPEEIEQGIVLKIENSLRGISGIKKITSTSKENYGQVIVQVISGYNTDIVLQDVRNAVDAINSFPAGMEPANTSKWEFRSRAIEFMLSGDVDLKILKSTARTIENELLQINGISKINLSGYPDEEIEIAFRENDLQAYNISFIEAKNAISRANIDLTGGTIRGEDEELFIRTTQKQFYANDLKDIILKTSDTGAIIRVSDVANVRDKWAEVPNRVYVDGEPAVVINVQYTANEDIKLITGEVRNYIENYNASNDIMKATILVDESVSVNTMQSILFNSGVLGFIFVMLFLTIFLNQRLSFWVALSIPISFLGMFFLASAYGLTLNRISLFGMIIVVGILVDDGIVIGENIFQHHEKGKKPVRAAIDGTLEVLPAVFSAVLTTVIAFSSMLLIEGMFGQMFGEMAFVVIATLVISLLEGALILPAHIAHSKALKDDRKVSKIEKFVSSKTMNFRDKYYSPALKWAITNKFLTLTIATSLFLITIAGINGGVIRMGSGGFNNVNYASVSLEMPPGTPESQTNEALNRIESQAIAVGEQFSESEGKPVVKSIVKEISSSSSGSVFVNLINTKERSFISTEFSNALRKEIGPIPEALRVNYVEESHFGKPVSVSILSNNLDDINGATEDLKYELEQLADLKNIVDNNESGMREVKIVLKDKAFLMGLDLQEVMSQVRSGFFGAEVQRINRGLDEVRIWVRYEKEDRATIGNLENMRIRTQSGLSVPLIEIADLTYERTITNIKHVNGQRAITVEADANDKNVNLTDINDELNNVILPSVKAKYPSIQFYFGGRSERMGEMFGSLLDILPFIIVLLYAVISLTFRSFLQSLIILALVPLGFIGLGWGHAIHGQAIDMPSYFGMLALLGIMVNDSIVLINTLNRNLHEGMEFMTAIVQAGTSRFRPIVLTSLSTMAGLFPLIIANDPDAQFLIPMAVAVAYGVLVATFLTLIVLPTILVVVNSIKCRIVKMRTGEMPTRESVEQAVKEMGVEQLI